MEEWLGHCGVSADMIKSLSFKYKINPDDLVHEYSPMVKIIYNIIKIIIHKNNVFPTNFNISIILPLLKDLTKSKSDITNIRPISISNYLAFRELDRLTSFETSLIKRILKFAPFHHNDMLLDAIKMNTLSEKIESISCIFYIRIINNEYTNNFTRELLRITGGVTTPNSILRPVIDMVSTSPLNRF
jgi:hypothetical protein